MKHRLFYILLATLSISAIAQDQSASYKYSLDLVNIKDDMAKVELIVPKLEYGDSIEFQFPKIVPGTYSIYDFGRFIHEFQAFDIDNQELKVIKIDPNRRQILNSKKLYRISYYVEDTYDSDKDTVIFEPAGTNFQIGKNYLINNFGFFGYLKDFKRIAFDINVIKPNGFYGATPLMRLQSTENSDRYLSMDYYELMDSPIMYTIPDTASMYLGETEILVSVYSPNNKLDAKEVLAKTSEILKAQAEYLGGTLPVDKYVILIYLHEGQPKSGGVGALEHSFSTLFTLPERSIDRIASTIVSVTAHEFFHIVTPLTIHSEEIHDFDFQNPKMSEHLWLYEGLTEYAAGHVQLVEGLITFDEYLKMMREKIRYSKKAFNDTLPFTVMSRACLDEYKDEYPNVYMKGALIGLSLDVLLRNYSAGSYGTQNLLRDLSKIYGKDKAFKDDELFPQISSLTYPEIGDFLNRHVDGSEPLPLKEIFELIGVNYYDSILKSELTLGEVGLSYKAENGRVFVKSTKNMNEFGTLLGLTEGDEITQINDLPINIENLNNVISQLKAEVKAEDMLTFYVARYNKRGKEKIYKLSAPARIIEKTKYNVLEEIENPSETQLALRKAWGNI